MVETLVAAFSLTQAEKLSLIQCSKPAPCTTPHQGLTDPNPPLVKRSQISESRLPKTPLRFRKFGGFGGYLGNFRALRAPKHPLKQAY